MNVILYRAALRGSICAAAMMAGGAVSAQTADIEFPSIPLQDYNCSWGPGLASDVDDDCDVDGTRTVTYRDQTREAYSPPPGSGLPDLDVVTSRYDVTFEGNLQVDGSPVRIDPSQPASSLTLTDASYYFDPDLQTVNVDTSYTGLYRQIVARSGSNPTPPDNPASLGAENIVTRVNSIDVNGDGNILTTSGASYDYTLNSIDPTDIVDNGVQLKGVFSGTTGTGGALQFGHLEGTAQFVEGNILTRYPEGTYDSDNIGLASKFALDYDVSAEVTTTLDADGLTTPTVSVTDGVDMNGSKIIDLADGTDATDAVNKGQLDTVDAKADTALTNAAAAQGTANTALANAATAQSSADRAHERIDALGVGAGDASGESSVALGNSTSNGDGAVSIGLENEANGNGAVAIGDPNIATGTGAVAIGADNTATGDGAVALGNQSTANGASALAMGDSANADGAGNIAFGTNAQATAANSVAIGAGSVADGADTVSVGAAGSERRVTNVAAGTGATDAVNRGQLDNLAALRQAAELQLSQRIAVQETFSTNMAAAFASEQAARIAADNALSARLDTMGTRLGAVEQRLDILDDRIASSTAIATAMSGNAFLPDMRFNLTANMATYDGAHAGSLQVGALVSEHVAVNAGVATGFNRDGKTAARAGVTFGF